MAGVAFISGTVRETTYDLGGIGSGALPGLLAPLSFLNHGLAFGGVGNRPDSSLQY